MATVPNEIPRFTLPTRNRGKRLPEDSLDIRLALADRIADLPYIHTLDRDTGSLPGGVDVLLRTAAVPARKRRPDLLFCSISRDGIATYGLTAWDKHQVLSRGWGQLRRDYVLLLMPREAAELEICWTILQRAYESLLSVSAGTPQVRSTWVGDLPKFSRTPLQ